MSSGATAVVLRDPQAVMQWHTSQNDTCALVWKKLCDQVKGQSLVLKTRKPLKSTPKRTPTASRPAPHTSAPEAFHGVAQTIRSHDDHGMVTVLK